MKRKTIIGLDFEAKDGTKWKAGMILRTTAILAERLVAQGSHRYTTKGKLKSFINRDNRLRNNAKRLEGIEFTGTKNDSVSYQIRDQYNQNRVYGVVRSTLLGKPKKHIGYGQRFVMAFSS